MSDFNEIQPDERLERRTRRRFSATEKKRLLEEADALAHGEKGPWLRRNGLYAGQLSTWRRELTEHGEAGLAGKAPGRKPADPRDREIERLQRANAKLERRAEVVEVDLVGQDRVHPDPGVRRDEEVEDAAESAVPRRAVAVAGRHGIRRDRIGLEDAQRSVEQWCRYALPRQFSIQAGWELQNMLILSWLMIESALTREESRGVHLRSDFPETDDEHWLRHQTFQRQ